MNANTLTNNWELGNDFQLNNVLGAKDITANELNILTKFLAAHREPGKWPRGIFKSNARTTSFFEDGHGWKIIYILRSYNS